MAFVEHQRSTKASVMQPAPQNFGTCRCILMEVCEMCHMFLFSCVSAYSHAVKHHHYLPPLPIATSSHITRPLQSVDISFPVIRYRLSRKETVAELPCKLTLSARLFSLPSHHEVDRRH